MEYEQSKEWKEGWDAYWQAKLVFQCEYPYYSKQGEDWHRGYSDAQRCAEEDKDEHMETLINS